MAPTNSDANRKLVKTRLRPDLYAELDAYRERTHRSISSAAEHLIALGLEAERGPQSDIHTR
ncbi:hypothetical protein [Pseudonocardia sp. NPDC049154]|uniref:hypothetical protein n=1 Tax=Pseudonocardia sp. NPDC049154 TaxID=3155501 RepID=UPI0033EEC326